MTRTINTRSITVARRAMLSAAMAAAILGTPLSAMAVDYNMTAMTSDLLTLQAQTMPMPTGVQALPADGNLATSRLDSFYNVVAHASSIQGPSFSADASPGTRLDVPDLWKAAEGVYNTLDARCSYWLENAGPPVGRLGLSKVAGRIEALEAGAQRTGAPGERARVGMSDVDALMLKLENFVDGMSAIQSYRPWESAGWRMNLTSVNESMNTFYDQVSGLCADLRK